MAILKTLRALRELELDHLKQRIVASVTPYILQRTLAKVFYKLDVSTVTIGVHTKIYQGIKNFFFPKKKY